jgi:hypothetical protein
MLVPIDALFNSAQAKAESRWSLRLAFGSRPPGASNSSDDRWQEPILTKQGLANEAKGNPECVSGTRGRLAAYSCRTTVSSDFLTLILPLYSMKPSLLNLFRKKFTRERVVPIMPASVSCDTFGSPPSGFSSSP